MIIISPVKVVLNEQISKHFVKDLQQLDLMSNTW